VFDLLKLIKIGKFVRYLVFSDNLNLGVASGKCAYVFDRNGNLLNKVCGDKDMISVSYCCGKFGFINWDLYAYIINENGKLTEKIRVGYDYDDAITMIKDGFVACGTSCAFFDFNGNMKWGVTTGVVSNNPSYYKDYWYVAVNNWHELLIVKDGEKINVIKYDEIVFDTAVCGKYLAVSTDSYLYLYDLNDPVNPSQLWSVGGFNGARQVAFSPGCEYIVVIDGNNQKSKIFNIEGDLIFEKEYWDDVVSAAWKDDRIAVGVGTDLIIYFISPFHCFI